MANDNIMGKIRVVLELPDGGIPRPPVEPPRPQPTPKTPIEIMDEIIQVGVAATNWESDKGFEKPGVGETTFTLIYKET